MRHREAVGRGDPVGAIEMQWLMVVDRLFWIASLRS